MYFCSKNIKKLIPNAKLHFGLEVKRFNGKTLTIP